MTFDMTIKVLRGITLMISLFFYFRFKYYNYPLLSLRLSKASLQSMRDARTSLDLQLFYGRQY